MVWQLLTVSIALMTFAVGLVLGVALTVRAEMRRSAMHRHPSSHGRWQ